MAYRGHKKNHLKYLKILKSIKQTGKSVDEKYGQMQGSYSMLSFEMGMDFYYFLFVFFKNILDANVIIP